MFILPERLRPAGTMRSVTDPTNDVVTGDRHVGVAAAAGSGPAVLVTVSLPDSPIRPERELPMNTSSDPAEPQALDYAQEQQQQQQQQ